MPRGLRAVPAILIWTLRAGIARNCLATVSPWQFWSISELCPDLVKDLHQQVRLMGNFGLNGRVPWLTNTYGTLCFICKSEVEDLNHFVVNCSNFKDQFESLWSNLDAKIISSSFIDVGPIAKFIRNLNHQERLQLLLGEALCYPLIN